MRVRGLTLTEVVLALTVVSMVLVSILGLGMQSLQFTEVSKNSTIASTLAQQGVEIVRSGVGYCQVEEGNYEITNSDQATFVKITGAPERLIADHPNFRRTINVRKLTTGETALVENNPENYSLVTVTVDNNIVTNPRKRVSVTVRAILPPPDI